MIIDISVAFLLASAYTLITGEPLTVSLLALCMVGTLLPDIDFLIWVIRGRSVRSKDIHKHRNLIHYPLILVPLSAGIVAYYDGWQLGVLFAIAVLAHFIHDTMGIGPDAGVRWLWPFDAHYYYLEKKKQGFAWHRWTVDEQDEVAEQFGDPHWIGNRYLSLHGLPLYKFVTFVISLVILTIVAMR